MELGAGHNDAGRLRFQRTTRYATLLIAAFAAFLTLGPGGPDTLRTVDDLALAAAALWATGACVAAARAESGERSAWILLAIASGAWAFGEVGWAVLELGLGHTDPFPSVADIGYLAAIPAAAAALIVWPAAHRIGRRIVDVLDALIVVGSLLFVSWTGVLNGVLSDAGGSALARVISLIYPLGDVLIATLAVLVLARTAGGRRNALGLVLAGLLALTAADTGYAVLTQTSGYDSGHIIDAAWALGYVLIGLGACHPGASPAAHETGRAPTLSGLLLPYAPVVIALPIYVYRMLVSFDVDVVFTITAVAIGVAVLVRQVLAAVDVVRLNADLECKVTLRTHELARQEARFRSLAQHSSDAIVVMDRDGEVLWSSASAPVVLGAAFRNLERGPFVNALHPRDRDAAQATLLSAARRPRATVTGEWRLIADGGPTRRIEARVTNLVDDPAVGGFVLNARDVTQRHELEEELRHQAFHDPLTSLPNRALFHERVSHALVRHARGEGAPAVLFIDVDDFKTVNDAAGHPVGDELLRGVATRLAESIRTVDTAARLGGDEFAVLLEAISRAGEAEDVAGRIVHAMAVPFVVGGRELRARVSVGVAVASLDGCTADDLLRDADVALYAAKLDGKGRWRSFEPAMRIEAIDRLTLEADLPLALARGEFDVHYQPVIELATGEWIGFEALARWTHPERGPIPPAVFIPAAERSGLVVELGEWVLRRACEDLARWQEQMPDLRMAVNLSARQLREPGLDAMVQGVLAATGVAADRLVLELTESVLLDEGEGMIDALSGLERLGVRLAIDDFGTGYSSLSYLSRLPFHTLKIDRSFVNELPNGGRSSSVLDAIVHLAHELRMDVVAEGVEDQGSADVLGQLGCEYGQGYLWARPLPAAAVDAEIVRHTPRAGLCIDH